MTSPEQRALSATLTPLTLTPFVLFRSLMTQWPARKANWQCKLETCVMRTQISHDSRRPIVMTGRSKGIESPPPAGFSSPFTRTLVSVDEAAGAGNQTRLPHDGHGASPGGCEGSSRSLLPHTGQRLGSPSGVRDAMFMARPDLTNSGR